MEWARTRERSVACISRGAHSMRLELPRKRRSCCSTGRPRQSGCFWRCGTVRASPRASITSITASAPTARSARPRGLRRRRRTRTGPCRCESERIRTPRARVLCGYRLPPPRHTSRRCGDQIRAGRAVRGTTDVPRPAHGNDGDATRTEVDVATRGERLQRKLIADALDEDGAAKVHRNTSRPRLHSTITDQACHALDVKIRSSTPRRRIDIGRQLDPSPEPSRGGSD